MTAIDVANARRAAIEFATVDLLPTDRVGIFTTSTAVALPFTADRRALLAALGRVVTHQRRPDYRPGSCPRIGVHQAYLIASFYNEHSPELDLARQQAASCPMSHCSGSGIVACIQAQARQTLSLAEQFGQDSLGTIGDVIAVLRNLPGERIIVLASSGFWSQTVPQARERVIDAALRANVVINSLDAKGLDPNYSSGKPEDGPPIPVSGASLALQQELDIRQRDMLNDSLAQLSDATGGRFFHNSNDLGRGLRELAAVPEVSYVLGFSPENTKPDGKFHELKVKVAGHPEYSVLARKGYFVPLPEKDPVAAASGRREELDREVMATDTRTGIPVEINAGAVSNTDSSPDLKVGLNIEIRKLPFVKREDRSAERLIIVTALFDSNNQFLTGTEGVMDLSLKEETLRRLSENGLKANLTLSAPPGKYRLRQVVQEEGNGLLAALSQPVEIH